VGIWWSRPLSEGIEPGTARHCRATHDLMHGLGEQQIRDRINVSIQLGKLLLENIAMGYRAGQSTRHVEQLVCLPLVPECEPIDDVASGNGFGRLAGVFGLVGDEWRDLSNWIDQ